MTEKKLTEADRKRIKDEIKLTSIIALIFSIALIILVLIVPLILHFFGKTADGFGRRSLYVMCGLSLPFLAMSWGNLFKFIDLKRGKKLNFKTTDYEIKKEKEDFVLKVKSPIEVEFDLYNKIPTLLKTKESLTLETTRLSKTLLFISQDNENLLERIEKEDDF
jgi:hypothetical protein